MIHRDWAAKDLHIISEELGRVIASIEEIGRIVGETEAPEEAARSMFDQVEELILQSKESRSRVETLVQEIRAAAEQDRDAGDLPSSRSKKRFCS